MVKFYAYGCIFEWVWDNVCYQSDSKLYRECSMPMWPWWCTALTPDNALNWKKKRSKTTGMRTK